jgi:hypothetical protein
MATLILTAIGSALGGPIGGAIGAVLGQQVDTRLFAPKARQGPRLNELAVQTSSYGNPIPRLFGRTRTSGTVIWATDLIESKRKVSGGKGRPKQTVYSYSANFAVALSARPIHSIGRIWADGRLLRGAGGDFKTAATMRIYAGQVDQAADPLIASAEGTNGCPAYRGLSYVVFEDFELADYGNRIPSLSFEVIADQGPVPLDRIITDLAPGSVAEVPDTVDGFVATGISARAILQSLADLLPFSVQDGDPLGFRSTAPVGPMVPLAELGASTNGAEAERFAMARTPLADLPSRTSLSYYDPDRDYLEGAQTALRPDLGGAARGLELAATLTAGQARQLVERQAQLAVTRRSNASINLPWRWLSLSTGQRISLPEEMGDWIISNWRWEAMRLTLDLIRPEQLDVTNQPSEPGRVSKQPDLLIGETRIALLDLPWLGAGLATQSTLYVVTAGTERGWRSAALLQSLDGGVSFDEVGNTAAPAAMGESLNALAPFTGHGFDERSVVDIRLLNSGMALATTTRDGLIAGQNLAVMGDELIQFQRAERMGQRDWKLSGLLRGRRGTEWAGSTHATGDRFILLSSESLQSLEPAHEGAAITVAAHGQGDPQAQLATAIDERRALLPPSPAHLRAISIGNDISFAWVRRSRLGWAWSDGIDAPLAEETEHYSVTLQLSNGQMRQFDLSAPAWIYDAASRANDLANGATSMTVTVKQQGTHGLSKPASLTLSL